MADGVPSSSHPLVDGIRPDSTVGSPSSSSGGASRQRQKQVPISRSTTSGYERPERARTSHACEPCRERKTKCDGERPSCRRCLHTGTICHYGYGKGWKKRKYARFPSWTRMAFFLRNIDLTCHRTAEDLNVTSSKLARYERLLNDIFPLVSTDVRNMIDDVRQQVIVSLPHYFSFCSLNLRNLGQRRVSTRLIRKIRLRTRSTLKEEERVHRCTGFLRHLLSQ